MLTVFSEHPVKDRRRVTLLSDQSQTNHLWMSALGVLAYEDQQFCVNKSCNRWKEGGESNLRSLRLHALLISPYKHRIRLRRRTTIRQDASHWLIETLHTLNLFCRWCSFQVWLVLLMLTTHFLSYLLQRNLCCSCYWKSKNRFLWTTGLFPGKACFTAHVEDFMYRI